MSVKQFLLLASDHVDAGAYDRRMSARADHIAFIDQLRDSKQAIVGAALLDETGKMIGSTLFLNMTQEELDSYLRDEPYITNRVWDKIEVKECRIGPSFENR